MPDIQHSVASLKSITLPEKLTEFDILLPDEPFADMYVHVGFRFYSDTHNTFCHLFLAEISIQRTPCLIVFLSWHHRRISH